MSYLRNVLAFLAEMIDKLNTRLHNYFEKENPIQSNIRLM